ncbi:MAG: carboxypeptidase-like regulatory domain-containing protein [Bryobacteraceae bacterium]
MTRCFFAPPIVFLVGFGSQLNAQSGTIAGKTEDPSGAPVPEARVTVTNQGTNAEMKRQRQSNGNFVAPFLPPGMYRISVEKTGFKRLRRYPERSGKLRTAVHVILRHDVPGSWLRSVKDRFKSP